MSTRLVILFGAVSVALFALTYWKTDIDAWANETVSLHAEQESEAQELAGQSFVKQKDGRVTPLGSKDAEMMVATCSILRKVKFSDMTPDMLSAWRICRSHGIGR